MICRNPVDNAFCSIIDRATSETRCNAGITCIAEEGRNFNKSTAYPYHIISILLAGEQTVSYLENGKIRQCVLTPGNICFVNKNCPFKLSWAQACSRLGCGCSREWLKLSWHHLLQPCPDDNVPVLDLWFSEYLDDDGRLYKFFDLGSGEYQNAISPAAGVALARLILLKTKDAIIRRNTGPKKKVSTYEVIKSYVDEYFHTGISRKTIATYFALNIDYVTRLFKENNQMLLSDYINDLRLKKGRALLVDSDLSIKDIARMCGYSCDNYFIKLFKQRFSCSPGEYRAQHRRELLKNAPPHKA